MQNQVIHSLAWSVVLVKDEIVEWYKDPEVRRNFEAWLDERRKKTNDTDDTDNQPGGNCGKAEGDEPEP